MLVELQVKPLLQYSADAQDHISCLVYARCQPKINSNKHKQTEDNHNTQKNAAGAAFQREGIDSYSVQAFRIACLGYSVLQKHL